MASEYLKMKAREQPPPEKPRELTRKEKIRNWLHYNKLWLIIGAVLLLVAGTILWNLLGIGKTKPDYIAAYVGRKKLPEDCAASLVKAMEALGEDVNGDGKVCVELRQYVMGRGGDAETAMYYNYAADTKLLADITAAESYFFLTEDPEGVQLAYQIFANEDGSRPEETDLRAADKVYRWENCPALSGPDADPPALGGLYIGRRCFADPSQSAKQKENEALWRRMTEGATR